MPGRNGFQSCEKGVAGLGDGIGVHSWFLQISRPGRIFARARAG